MSDSATGSFPQPFAGNGLLEHFTRQIAEISTLSANVNAGDVTAVTWNHSSSFVVHNATTDVDFRRGTFGRTLHCK